MSKEDLRTHVQYYCIREVNIFLGIFGFPEVIFDTSFLNAVTKTMHSS